MDNLQVLTSQNRYDLEDGFYSSANGNEIDDTRANQLITDGHAVQITGKKDGDILKGGRLVGAYDDHTNVTVSGAGAANVTLDTVSGKAGETSGVTVGSPTGSPSMVRAVGNASAGSTNFSLNVTSVDINGRLGVWMYSDPDNAFLPSCNITVNTTAGELSHFFNTNQIRPGWNFLVLNELATDNNVGANHPLGTGYSYGGGSSIGNNISWIRFEVTSMANKTVIFDTAWYDFDQTPQIVFGFDSADEDALTNGLPILNKYGYVGYIAEPGFVWSSGSTRFDNLSETGARIDRMQSFYDAGWDIVNHTASHRNIGSMTDPAEIRYEVEIMKAWQLAHGWERGAEFYVSPQSNTSPLAESVIESEGFVLQRHATKRNVHRTPFGIDNPNSIGSYDLGNQTLDEMKAVIDANIAYGADTHIFAHNVVKGGASDGNTRTGGALQVFDTQLDMLFEYIKSLEEAGSVGVARGYTDYYTNMAVK